MTCLILCGGKSKRMGRPKEFLPLAGTTMLEHILDRALNLFADVLLVTNKPEDYEHLSADIVKDIVPDRGPLAGILSGLLVAQYQDAFVLPCDMPLFTENQIRELAAQYWEASRGPAYAIESFSLDRNTGARGIEQSVMLSGTNDPVRAVIHSNVGNESYLPGVFSGSLIPAMEEMIFSQKYSLSEFLATITHRKASSAAGGSRLPAYFNVDTPMDYIRLVHS